MKVVSSFSTDGALTLIVSFISIVAPASGWAGAAQIEQSYAVGPAYVIPVSPGLDAVAEAAAKCPVIIGTEVEASGGGLSPTSMKLIYDGKAQDELAFTGLSRSCYSDIVCPTTDDFSSKDGSLTASLTHNNDGEYPTHDRPGYSALSVIVTSGASSTPCYYPLQ